MNETLPLHWQVMEQMNAELYKNVTDWRRSLANDQTIPKKYKELMMVVMCCVIRYKSGIRTHAHFALENGATKAELFSAIAETMKVGGIPAYTEGILTLDEMFGTK